MTTRTAHPHGGLGAGAASAAGGVLHAAFAALGRIRPTEKPLHPRGAVLPATVHRYGATVGFGVPWLDEPGTDRAVVRFSRGAGLPEFLPDVLGIAIRLEAEPPADLLLATTGRGVVGRFLLVPRRAAAVSLGSTYGTLQPYRSPTGPVVLSATPDRDGDRLTLALSAARPAGSWHGFGSVVVDTAADPRDEPISFDPILNVLPGLENYPWVARTREGAYRAARRSRQR
jgi:hypothetical protein